MRSERRRYVVAAALVGWSLAGAAAAPLPESPQSLFKDLFVAVQTVRDRRKFQPPMTTWYAAMLFAVIPLRNALINPPPFGAWVDVTVVVWVIVVLVISMTLYIFCWWRHLRPEVDKPT